MSNRFQDDTLRLHPWPERAYPSLTREPGLMSIDLTIVAPDGCSSAYSWSLLGQKLSPASAQAAGIKRSASRTSSDWTVEGNALRPGFRGLVGILLLALEHHLSCALSFFQSTREYVSGKGTLQILLLISPIISAQRPLAVCRRGFCVTSSANKQEAKIRSVSFRG